MFANHTRMVAPVAVLLFALLLAAPAIAQSPSAGPAKNPASRFDGIWMKDGNALRYNNNPPYRPEWKAKFDALRPQDDPHARCVESGLPRMMIAPSPLQMVAFDNQLVLIEENFHAVRRIWLDTREHDPDADPGFYGDPVVHWEGDVMVVDTIGFNGMNYIDAFGDLQTNTMHIVERWQLLGKDRLQIEFTFDDPTVYTAPWTGKLSYSRKADWRFSEFSCTENNRNDPTNPANPKDLTSTDAPAAYKERPPPGPGR